MRDSSQQTKERSLPPPLLPLHTPPLQLLLLLLLLFFTSFQLLLLILGRGGHHCQPQFALLLYFSNWLGKSVPRHVFITEVCEGLTPLLGRSPIVISSVRHYTHTHKHTYTAYEIKFKSNNEKDVIHLFYVFFGLNSQNEANLREVDF